MRRPLIGGKDFNTSIRQGEQAQGGVKEAYQGRGVRVFFSEEERGEWVWERIISSYVWKNVIHGKKNYVQKKHMEGSCV